MYVIVTGLGQLFNSQAFHYCYHNWVHNSVVCRAFPSQPIFYVLKAKQIHIVENHYSIFLCIVPVFIGFEIITQSAPFYKSFILAGFISMIND